MYNILKISVNPPKSKKTWSWTEYFIFASTSQIDKIYN